MNKIKLIAFTLAETLLVMGIIGVVAALVVPLTRDNSSEQVNVAKTKKLYSELQTAYEYAVNKYGHPADWGDSASGFLCKIAEYMNTSTSCTTTPLTLKDGGTIDVSYSTNPKYYQITLDVDGAKKGANTLGKDKFYADVDLADLINIPSVEPYLHGHGTVTTSNHPDAANNSLMWVIKYGNQDYNTCASSLTWEGKVSCK